MSMAVDPLSKSIIFRSTQLILCLCKGMEFLKFRPSEIAASGAINIVASTQFENMFLHVNKWMLIFLLIVLKTGVSYYDDGVFRNKKRENTFTATLSLTEEEAIYDYCGYPYMSASDLVSVCLQPPQGITLFIFRILPQHRRYIIFSKLKYQVIQGFLLQGRIVKLQQYREKIIWNFYMFFMVKNVGFHISILQRWKQREVE
ncbi:hypothetical protein L2E82_23092 [Cichorium intybus]|uniref:Uncharacterized protein n=1 Tax=Cichorium intybus TaxID=13427 RepID=A0ACB9DZ77_CICIN|nr:hypothetical protein L2E82_23092 [Cichorium intybus]